jgi:hypothetical protein
MRGRLLTIPLLLLCAADARSMVLRKAGSANAPPVGNPSLAATWTAKYNGLCSHSKIGDYWAEIDSSTGTILWSFQSGSTITRAGGLNGTGKMQLDSASKFIAEALEAIVLQGVSNYTATEIAQTHQMDGSANQPSTVSASLTIATGLQVTSTIACSPATGQTINGFVITSSENGAICNGDVGLFDYNGAHFNVNALTYGSSSLYNVGISALATYVNATLGITGITYSGPQLAGQANASPATMLSFLQMAATNPYTQSALGAYTTATNYLGNTGTQGQSEPAGGTAGNYIGQTIWDPEGTPGFITVTNSTTIGAAGPNGAWLINGISQNGKQTNQSTATSGTTTTVLTDSTQSWTTNQWSAYQLLDITRKTACNVGANTATTVSCQGASSIVGMVSGDTYAFISGSSPIPENWLYSMMGWEETDPASNGDGAYSSAGADGFYPWISHDKSLVGVLAALSGPGTGFQSAQCGRVIRRAWTSGNGQSASIPTP